MNGARHASAEPSKRIAAIVAGSVGRVNGDSGAALHPMRASDLSSENDIEGAGSRYQHDGRRVFIDYPGNWNLRYTTWAASQVQALGDDVD